MTELRLSVHPLFLVDFVGALLMILFSFLALSTAVRLFLKNPRHIFFGYLLGLSFAFAAFAVSRSFGHIAHVILLWTDKASSWRHLAPFSGAFNTVFLLLAAFLTLVFPLVYAIFSRTEREAQALRITKAELEEANRRLEAFSRELEELVEERTQALAVSEEKFRKLFEASGDAILFCDSDGGIRDINPAGVLLLGASSKDELLGRSLGDFFCDPGDWKRYKEELCGQGRVHNYETAIRNLKGERRQVIITANAIEYVEGCRLGCQGIIKDITSLKEMMERLIHSEKMVAVGQLAAGMAHELNTPLGIIKGYTQLLLEEGSPWKEELRIIEDQVEACQKLVQNLLLFARYPSGAEKGRVYLNEVLEQVVGMIYHTYRKEGVRIVFKPGQVPPVRGEEGRLREVFFNLLANARDALDGEGFIFIWTRAENGQVFCEIGDTGCGIPEGVRERIFEPFFTTKPPGRGTGLGLTVAYGIVKDHGGEIEVFSPPPRREPYLSAGINTLFRIRLPGEGS